MPKNLAAIKKELDARIGKPLTVTSQSGRKKVLRRRGILRKTFPAVFIVELDQDESAVENASFSYTDVLTQNIELSFEDGHD